MIALKFFLTISLLFLTLTSCVGGNGNAYLGFSKSGFIKSYDSVKIRLRHLDIVNALRQENGLKNSENGGVFSECLKIWVVCQRYTSRMTHLWSGKLGPWYKTTHQHDYHT